MRKTDFINSRVEPELKKDAERIFLQLGLSMSDAVTLFLRQSVMHQGLPFDVRIPNKDTSAAIKESHQNLKRYSSSKEMVDDILK